MNSPKHVQVKMYVHLWKLMANVGMSRNALYCSIWKNFTQTIWNAMKTLLDSLNFYELQPKKCIPVGGSSGIHSVCACENNLNFKLLTSQILEISDCKELLSKTVCNIDHRNCMLRSCNECPSLADIKQFLLDILDQHEIESFIYNQWQKEKKNKHCNIVQINTSSEDFVDEVC